MQLEGSSRRLPIYLVLDVSGSMNGAAIQAVNAGLKELETAVRQDPHALETAHFSVITFSDDATQIVPLTEAGSFHCPTLNADGYTCLGKAMSLLGDCFSRDLHAKDANHPGDWKPLVFLFTDGEPTDDDWRASVMAFRSRLNQRPADVVAIGCGPDANQDTLECITNNVMMSADFSPERITKLFQWISQSARIASKAASTPAGMGNGVGVNLPPPPAGFVIGK